MSDKVVLVIYGRGGHQEQMRRLLNQLKKASPEMKFVSIADVPDVLGAVKHLECPEPRDKFSRWGSPLKVCYAAIVSLIQCLRLSFKYDISGIVSTGPGMAVLPSVYFRLLGKHVVYIESWSRFFTGSLTGFVMYRIANCFYVQNRSMNKVFPKAKYAGRL
jgi:beta-1,4-N-acetylglucosaminyltransferase